MVIAYEAARASMRNLRRTPAPTCGSCRHWQVDANSTFAWGECCLISECDAPNAFVVGAAARSEFITRPDFGCTLHEPKETK